MPAKKVAVIGAGGSGLTSIKACLEQQLEVVCYERLSTIGGLWRYHEEDDHGTPSVMNSTVINTSKELSAFSDFPPPTDFPNHMHNTKMLCYLEMYAKAFDLMKHIRFRHEILKVSPTDDYSTTGRFSLRVKDMDSGKEKDEVYDGVMVCSGHHTFPNIPDFKGIESFKGNVIHTHSYKRPSGFEKKNVVVIGVGNSGIDVAVELSSISKQVYLSTRRGTWLLPLLGLNGIPNDILLNTRLFITLASTVLLKPIVKYLEYQLNQRFDHSLYGLKPKHSIVDQHPTVSQVLPAKIISGTVVIKSDVHHFTKNGVVFVGEEDKEYSCDTVILATGYNIKFPFLNEDIIDTNGNQCTLYKYVFPPNLKHFSLAFIGLIQPRGCIFPISESQARWYASHMAGKISFPDRKDIKADVERYRHIIENEYYPSTRHTIQVNYIPYMDEITEQFGAKPNLLKLALRDPKLFWTVFNGPCLPYQYRLEGPGAWKGAKKAILTFEERIKSPFETRLGMSKNSSASIIYNYKIICLIVLAFWFSKYFWM